MLPSDGVVRYDDSEFSGLGVGAPKKISYNEVSGQWSQREVGIIRAWDKDPNKTGNNQGIELSLCPLPPHTLQTILVYGDVDDRVTFLII